MAKKKIETKFEADMSKFDEDIKKSEQTLTSMRKELKLVSTQLKGDSENASLLAKKQELLQKESNTAAEKIQLLKAKLEASKKEYGENSDEVRILSNHLSDAKTVFAAIQNEIKQTNTNLSKLDNEASAAASSLDNVSKNADKSGDGFTVAKGAVANFISNGLTALGDKCKEVISRLAGLADETREYRENIGKLQVGFQTASYDADTATAIYKSMFEVLGEEDRSVEAANHLAKLTQSEKELSLWSNITAGVVGTFGDSLPIEGLTEAANETAKVSQVTGPLADALNWAAKEGETFGVKMKANTEANKEWNEAVKSAVSAEDYFNLALQQCSSEQERSSLITNTLNGLYSESAEKYREQNQTIMEANAAQSEYTDATADLGAKIEPVTNSIKSGFAGILSEISELSGFDSAGISNQISSAFESFKTDILPKILDGLQWINDHSTPIAAGIVGIGTAFAVFKVANLIKLATTALQGMTAAQALLAAKTKTSAVAQWLLNVALNANPIGLIIALIAGLVAAFVVLWKKSEKFRNFWIDLWKKIKEAASNFFDWFKGIPASIGKMFDNLKSRIKTPTIQVTYSSDGTLAKVAKALGLEGFPKLHIRWNKDGRLFKGKTIVMNGFAEAGDDEYALPLNKKTLDPLAAGVVSHMSGNNDAEIAKLEAVHKEIKALNDNLVGKITDAVVNKVRWKVNNRELARAVKNNV